MEIKDENKGRWESMVDSYEVSLRSDPAARGYAEAFVNGYDAGQINPVNALTKISYKATCAALARLENEEGGSPPSQGAPQGSQQNEDDSSGSSEGSGNSEEERTERSRQTTTTVPGQTDNLLAEKIGTNNPDSQLGGKRNYTSQVFTDPTEHQRRIAEWAKSQYSYKAPDWKQHLGHPYEQFKSPTNPIGYYGGMADVYDKHFANGNFEYSHLERTRQDREAYAVPYEFFGRFGLQTMELGHFRFMRAFQVNGGFTGEREVDEGIFQLLFTHLGYFQLLASEVTKKILTGVTSARKIHGLFPQQMQGYRFRRMPLESYIETVSPDVNPNFEFSVTFKKMLQNFPDFEKTYGAMDPKDRQKIQLQEPFFLQLAARALKQPKLREALQERLGLQKDFFDGLAEQLAPMRSDKPKPVIHDSKLGAPTKKREKAGDAFRLQEYMKFLHFPQHERARVAKASKHLLEKLFPLGNDFQTDTDNWKLVEYQPGEDDPRHIAWHVSARVNNIIVKRFEQVQSKKKIYIYVDTECSFNSQTKIHGIFGSVIALIDGIKAYCRDGNEVYITSPLQDQYLQVEQKHHSEILAALLIPQNSHMDAGRQKGTRHKDARILTPGRKPDIPENFLYISPSDGKAAAATYQLRGRNQHATSFAQSGVQMSPRINPGWVEAATEKDIKSIK